MGFVSLFDLPYVNTKIQLPEIMVLLLAFVWLFSKQKDLWPGSRGLSGVPLFEGATLIFLLIAFLATLLHPTKAAVLENTGYVYLFVSSLIVQWLLHQGKASLQFFQQSFIQLGILLAGLNVILFTGYLSGIVTTTALVETKNLPFLGDIPRVLAWMPSVNLLADLMAFCWWLSLGRDAPSGKYARSSFILIGLLLTFSKSLLIILPLGLFLWIKNRKRAAPWLVRSSGVVVALSIVTYLFLTHVVVQPKAAPYDARQSYLTGKVLAETDNFVFLETSYLPLKKMQWLAAKENPVLGLGPANFNAFLKQAKDKGQYPAHLADYDPHSTLGGTLAEMGILGLLALLFWAFVIFRMIRRLLDKKQDSVFYLAMACYLLFVGVETLTTDVLNFRHIWICLGVVAWDYKRSLV
jgi:hypothetical protein